MILKLPREYTVKREDKEFQYLDSKGRVIFMSLKDDTDSRFKVWEHYYRDLGTNFLTFYEVEASDNKQLIYILLTVSVVSLITQIVSFIQQNELIYFVTNFY